MIIIPDPKVEDQESDIEGKMLEGKNISSLSQFFQEIKILKQNHGEWQVVEDYQLT